jgi:hypothetical protein
VVLMGGAPSSPQLQRERAHLLRNLYTLPRESSASPPGLPDHGPTTIRQLLTGVSSEHSARTGGIHAPGGRMAPHMQLQDGDSRSVRAGAVRSVPAPVGRAAPRPPL